MHSRRTIRRNLLRIGYCQIISQAFLLAGIFHVHITSWDPKTSEDGLVNVKIFDCAPIYTWKLISFAYGFDYGISITTAWKSRSKEPEDTSYINGLRSRDHLNAFMKTGKRSCLKNQNYCKFSKHDPDNLRIRSIIGRGKGVTQKISNKLK